MTNEPEASPADVLEPCPFCGVRLERGMHKRRNRDGSFAYMCAHPDVEPRCVASSVVVWAGERESEDAWNRRASRAPVDGAKPVGEAGEMPGSNGGFSMAVFKASDVPVGTKLYTHPAPASPDAEMVTALVDSLRHSFITSQSDGSEDEYRLVAQFKTLPELQRAYAALMDILSKHESDRS